MSRFRLHSALALIAAAALAPAARAGNDDELPVGNLAAMTGGAVTAKVSDGSALWYNPAGLGSVSQTHIDVSGTVYSLRFYSAPGILQSTTGEEDDGAVSEFVSVPSQIAYARDLGRGFTLGLGYFAPQASNLLLRRSLTATDGVNQADWQVAVGVNRVQHNFAAGVGLALTPRARVGFSLVGTYEAQRQSASIVAISSEGGLQRQLTASSLLGTFTRVGLEVGAGFQLQLGRALTLALSARSPRFLVQQSADSTMSAAAVDLETDQLFAELSEPKEGSTPLHIFRAGRATAGIAYEPSPGTWLSVELDVQPSVYNERAGVEREAVVNARLGGCLALSESVTLGAGLFSDRSPDPKTDEALNSHGHFYGGSLGIELRDKHLLDKDDPAEDISLSTTIAVRYAYSNGDINDLLIDPSSEPAGTFSAQRGDLIAHETSLYFGGGVSF